MLGAIDKAYEYMMNSYKKRYEDAHEIFQIELCRQGFRLQSEAKQRLCLTQSLRKKKDSNARTPEYTNIQMVDGNKSNMALYQDPSCFVFSLKNGSSSKTPK